VFVCKKDQLFSHLLILVLSLSLSIYIYIYILYRPIYISLSCNSFGAAVFLKLEHKQLAMKCMLLF